MAGPLPTKTTVDLAAIGLPRSRIRRDPPPVTRELREVDVEEREARTMVIGVTVFAVALFVLALAVSNAAGWSPSQYSLTLKEPPRAVVKER